MPEMTKEILNQKSLLYEENIDDWNLFTTVFESGKNLIDYALFKYEFEKTTTHEDRLKDGFIFNPGRGIINVFNFYLTETEPVRELGKLDEDELWKMFIKDSDLKGTNYDDLLNEGQKMASVNGAVGILVNKPMNPGGSVASAIKYGIYPYLALYSLQNIYEWKFERNKETHRVELTFLKLREEDGTYHFWYKDRWEIWRYEPRGEHKDDKPKKIDEGDNPLGEIPFFWMINLKRSANWYLGTSDLVEIARIVCSIARDLSNGQEVIKMAGFPMLRLPMMENKESMPIGDAESEEDGDQESSPRTVHYFPPDFGEAGKPDWMPTEIFEPIQAVLMWIDAKITQCFQIALLSGIHGQRSGESAESGLKLRYEFKQLFSVLSKKSDNITEAELSILKFWLKWSAKEELFSKIKVTRPKKFSLDDLAVALNNIFVACRNVVSKTFRVQAMDQAAEYTLPNMSDETREKIHNENEANTPDMPPLFESQKDDLRNQSGDPGDLVRPADET